MANTSTRHIFLSPHYDDVALSCGGTVARHANEGASPLIVNVMGGRPTGPLTEFALGQHERWGFAPSEAVEMRRSEDRCGAETLGADSMWLDVLDAIYRGDRYTSDEDIFGDIHPDEHDLPARIVASLEHEPTIGLRAIDHFYVPLAIGNHVDHQLVFLAGQLLAERGLEVWGYEDFPYAGDPKWRESVQERFTNLTSGDLCMEWLTTSQLDSKVAAILCYRSQLDVIFRFQGDPTESVRRYAAAVGGGEAAERFWRL